MKEASHHSIPLLKDKHFIAQDHERFQSLPGPVKEYLSAGRKRQEPSISEAEQIALCQKQLKLLGEIGKAGLNQMLDYSDWRYQKVFKQNEERQKPQNGVVYEVFSAKRIQR
jgi:hypothetical protein